MAKKSKISLFLTNVCRYKALILMAIPAMIWMLFFFYIPVLTNVVAFKNFQISPDGFMASLKSSPWVGFDNFKFLFLCEPKKLYMENLNITIVLRNVLVNCQKHSGTRNHGRFNYATKQSYLFVSCCKMNNSSAETKTKTQFCFGL